MVGKERDSLNLANSPVTNVPQCTGSNAKTLGMKQLHFLDMSADGGPADGGSDFERSHVSQPLICTAKYRSCSGGVSEKHATFFNHYPCILINQYTNCVLFAHC